MSSIVIGDESFKHAVLRIGTEKSRTARGLWACGGAGMTASRQRMAAARRQPMTAAVPQGTSEVY